MAQPTLDQLLGQTVSLDTSAGTLTIGLADLQAVGLDNVDFNNSIPIFAAIVKLASNFLIANLDESVMATCDFTANSPVNRNNIDKTLFTFALGFYGTYTEPLFDPDNIV